MKRRRQPGFFDIDEHTAKLTQMGEPLVGLNEQIDWEAYRCDLNRVHEKERKSNAGAEPIDVVLMLMCMDARMSRTQGCARATKVRVLQQLHNLSDERIEYPIRDRRSFMGYLGLEMHERVPDAKPVWLFRERLKDLKLVDVLFARFNAPFMLTVPTGHRRKKIDWQGITSPVKSVRSLLRIPAPATFVHPCTSKGRGTLR